MSDLFRAFEAHALSATAIPVNVEPAAAEPAFQAALERDAVLATSFARRTLYTWTTAAQIAELRQTRRLLVREESPIHGASQFEQVVHALADRGDPIAKLLDTTTYAKSRFAWPAPWATREGWEGEQYGDQLVRVTLKADAIVLGLTAATGAFEARDLSGGSVPLGVVLAHPQRLAAVYFVSSYREYVLCNEAMVATWSVGTADIAEVLEANATMLDALARHLRTQPASTGVEPQRSFAAALAFPSATYRLDPDALEQIARHLRATPKPEAFEGGEGPAFPGVGQARKPPRVIAKPRGTYGNGTY